jgi:YHS domain-containing protein
MGVSQVDPVCGMEVDSANAPFAQRELEKFSFCSEDCRTKFLSQQVAPPQEAGYRSGGPGREAHQSNVVNLSRGSRQLSFVYIPHHQFVGVQNPPRNPSRVARQILPLALQVCSIMRRLAARKSDLFRADLWGDCAFQIKGPDTMSNGRGDLSTVSYTGPVALP